MNQSFIITGASGWLGQRIVGELLSGRSRWLNGATAGRIRVLVEKSTKIIPSDWAPIVEVVVGDVRNKDDCDRLFDGFNDAVLIHTVGLIHPQRVSDFFSVNVQGTINIFESAIAANVARAVIVSSNSPIGVSRDPNLVFDEKSPYRPYMGYGRSKMQMEQALLATGLGPEKLIIIRAPWFYGPGQPPRQTLFFKMVEDGRFPVLGRGVSMRSMSYIDNLVQGLLLAATHPNPKSQIYWIADRRPYSMNEIVKTVEDVLAEDFKRPVKGRQPQLPGFIGTIAEKIDAILQTLGLYHQKIHVLSEMNKTIACSISKAERELNYHPEVDLREGMRTSVQWCKEMNLL